MQKAILGTGRPLTIACHIKNSYFLVAALSGLTAAESIAAAVVSGAATVFVSTVEVVIVSVVVVDSSVELSPHAAKAPIANTKRSFFILPVFVF
jgi:hypothetical protein